MKRIAVIGKQCSGKSTVAKSILSHYNGEMIKFADPLYRMLYVLNQDKNRGFMQEGADVVKKYFGENIFVQLFRENVRGYMASPQPRKPEIIVCDDLRYKVELDAARDMGFGLVFVHAMPAKRRERAKKQGLDFIEEHSSECEVDSLRQYADVDIKNNSTLTHLFKQIDDHVMPLVTELSDYL